MSKNASFTYNLDTPQTNLSYANRIAVENFEYAENTNLSKLSRYADSDFSCIIKDFKDIDFDGTNYTYQSKLCEITKLTNLYHSYSITYNLTDRDIRVSYPMMSSIVKPLDCVSQSFILYYNVTNFLTYQLNFFNREFRVLNGSNYFSDIVTTKSNFIPNNKSYDYLYFSFTPMYVFVDFVLSFNIVCYNQTGSIISRNSTLVNLEPYKSGFLEKSDIKFTFIASNNQKMNIIAIDNNFVRDRRLYSQLSIMNDEYSMDVGIGIKVFYLTRVPFYSDLDFPSSNEYRYATTLYKGRYLRYLTNSTYLDVYDYLKNKLPTSFYIKTEFSLNDIVEGLFIIYNFTDRFIQINLDYSQILIYEYHINLTLIRQTIYNGANFFDNSTIIHAQFKNHLFSLTFLNNFTSISEIFYIPTNFQQITLRGTITNFEYKPLSQTNMIDFSNSTLNLNPNTDFLTLRDKINKIQNIFIFYNTINIPTNSITSVYYNDREYGIINSYIYNVKIESSRNVLDGYFSITSDYEVYEPLFDGIVGYNNSINSYALLNQKDGGNLYIRAYFYQTTSNEVTIDLVISYSRYLFFTDRIFANNLLIQKTLEILIPLMIFFLIVIGFKSNSDSKFLPIIGMYIGIFVFYLLDYMSLLFMLLSFAFLSLGLFIILRKEKGAEI